MAVLVSADTSSMGELTAYLIQHRPEGVTRLFGEPTYGVMSDATVYLPLFDGSLMQIVDTRIVNPDGVQLPERVEPDMLMSVDYTRYGGDDDLLIQAARAWLMEQPACG
jgi:C-terminal processing protease CtpA/Prc